MSFAFASVVLRAVCLERIIYIKRVKGKVTGICKVKKTLWTDSNFRNEFSIKP